MLKNQFSTRPFAAYAHKTFSELMPRGIPAVEKHKIIDAALDKFLPALNNHILVYRGDLSISGQTYNAVIGPHYYNSPARPNKYVVCLRATDGDISAFTMDFAPGSHTKENFPALLANAMKQPPGGKVKFIPPLVKNAFPDIYGEQNVYLKPSFRFKHCLEIADQIIADINAQLSPRGLALKEPDTDAHRRWIAWDLRESISHQRNVAITDFYKNNLDKDVVKFALEYHDDRIESYNILRRGFNRQTLDFRLGALQVAQRVSQSISHWEMKHLRIFWPLIDAGVSFPEAAAKAFQLPVPMMKRFFKQCDYNSAAKEKLDNWNRSRFLPTTTSGGYYARSAYFRKIPTLLWPENNDDWEAFGHITSAFGRPYNYDGHYLVKPLAKLSLAHRGLSWSRIHQGVLGGPTYDNKAGDQIMDMLTSMYEKVVLPVIMRAAPEFIIPYKVSGPIQRLISQAMGMEQLVKANTYWHSSRVDFPARINSVSLPEDTAWLPLIKNGKTPAGVIFEGLDTKKKLDAEAKAMDHCVWSYTSRCAAGESHIISLKDKNGARLSTLELHEIGKGSRRVKENQNRAYNNTVPCAAALQAARWLIEAINNGSVKANWGKIEARRAKEEENKKEHELKQQKMKIGFNYNDEIKCEQVRSLYHPCLPSKLRHACASGEEFLHKTGIARLLKKHGVIIPKPRSAASRPKPWEKRAAPPQHQQPEAL